VDCGWSVDRVPVKVIAQADSLEDVLKVGISPAHYKMLRAIDAKSFLGVVAEARNTVTDPVKDLEAGGRLLRRFYGYLITAYRVDSERPHRWAGGPAHIPPPYDQLCASESAR
jgi:hypothetical protein